MSDGTNVETVRTILGSVMYCTIATVSADGQPWNTPVFFGYDEQCNLFWRSAVQSEHSQNLSQNDTAAITVFDSQSPWGAGQGVYLQGTVEILEDTAQVDAALTAMDRRSPRSHDAQDFLGDSTHRVYHFAPQHVWLNVSTTDNKKFLDGRAEIPLEQFA